MPASGAPDRRRGVFETLLVIEGAPVELGVHLRRLGASVEELYGEPLPQRAGVLARSDAAPLRLGRLQLTLAPRQGGLECEAAAAEIDPALHFPARDRGARLQGLPLAGGLGEHKWADRSRLPNWEDAVPLLLDGHQVLEASRANVFIAVDGVLSTPPLDGRILPGTARAAVIELAREAGIEVREQAIERAELSSADEVFLTGSVRGVEPAVSLDDEQLGDQERIGPLLAARLRRRWHDSSRPAALSDGRSPTALGRAR